MIGPLKRFRIENHRGIVELSVSPDGKSLTLEGGNGAGKSSVLEGLNWIVNEDGSDSGMRNGAEFRKGEMVFGEYLITRSQQRGKKPTRNVPASALAEVRAALARTVFSAMGEKEQADTLRKLDPALDVSDLDKRRVAVYAARTAIGQAGELLGGQLAGMVIPEAPTEIGEEAPIADVVDVAAVAAKKLEAAQTKAENDRQREAAASFTRTAQNAIAIERREMDVLEQARQQVKRAEAALEAASATAIAAQERADLALKNTAGLIDPDTSAIDAEIAEAKRTNAAARAEAEAHNRTVRARQQVQRDHEAATERKAALAEKVAAERAKYAQHTADLKAIDDERAARIAAAKMPISGLSLVNGRAMYDDGKHGAVPISEGEDTPNAGERMRINVAVAAALGHKLIPIRNAGLMDDDTRARVETLAAEMGIQTISEIVRSGAPLTVVIEDDE